MSLDVKNLIIIDASEVPSAKRRTMWDEVFEAIEEGKALVIEEALTSPSNIRSALRSRQKKGLFQDYYITTKSSKGNRTTYVVHGQRE